MLNKMCICW